MGYKNPNTYALSIGFAFTNHLDSSPYYFGEPGQTTSLTAAIRRSYIPRDGIIKECVLCTRCTAAAGTGEDIPIQIRINNAAPNYDFSTVGVADELRFFSNYHLNIPVRQGDYLEFRMVTPAWVVNPQGMRGHGYILIECE